MLNLLILINITIYKKNMQENYKSRISTGAKLHF